MCMRVVFATAELSPVATVGGLAAAAAGLGAELRRAGVEVDLVMPDYGDVDLVDETTIELQVPEWVGAATIRTGVHPIVGRLHLVGVPGMARPHPYLQADGSGWPDNSERFFRFARAVAAFVEADPPDVLHLNDWHTGAALAALESPPPTVVSIHNLAYQGIAGPEWLELIGPRAAHFEWWGDTNPLSGALALADRVVAVSPNYVTEIITPEGGFGLDGPLRQRGDALIGVLNGIDTDVWNPADNPHLVANFDASSLAARPVNRTALLARLGLPDDGTPLATIVTRLTHQKGVDLITPLVPLLEQIPMRLGILGSGDAVLSAELHRLAAAHPDHLAFVEGYDESLSHQMFAGADAFLMPSRFEPCGLTQMQAMRYGAVPIVTAVGGLVDTVPDADLDAKRGVGFVAPRVESTDLLAAMFRAARRLKNKRRHATLQKRMMSIDWSWAGPAQTYVDLYCELADAQS
jgi:starch synthase